MHDNHNHKNVWDIDQPEFLKDALKSIQNGWLYVSPNKYPKHENILLQKAHKQWWDDLFKKNPIFVIDLDTLKLRPPKYK